MHHTELRSGTERAGRAWIESPLQLLSLVEARAAGRLFEEGRLLLRSGVAGLRETEVELRRHLPGDLPPGDSATRPRPPAGRDALWAIGDAFSGQVQKALLTAPRCRFLIVDDGLATWRLIRLLGSPAPRPLLRARTRPRPLRVGLGLHAAWVLRRAAREGRLTIFTMLPIDSALAERAEAVGLRIVRHAFDRLRSLPERSGHTERTILLGTALVADGLVHRSSYLTWLERQAESGPLAYYPHRREDPEVLNRLAAHPHVEVVRSGIPVELSLRGLGPGHTVMTPPSTALLSLRNLTRGADIQPVVPPEHWWTHRVTPGLRADLVAGIRLGEVDNVR